MLTYEPFILEVVATLSLESIFKSSLSSSLGNPLDSLVSLDLEPLKLQQSTL